VEQLIEKSLAVADRVYALARGTVLLEAPADQPGLAQYLERVYFGEQGLHGAAAAPHSSALTGSQA
jgi:branched-chain amino acid transport system ATP-binding protein